MWVLPSDYEGRMQLHVLEPFHKCQVRVGPRIVDVAVKH